jgi:transcriptional regulator with XRE-family HTH domain
MNTLNKKVEDAPWNVKLKILRVLKDCTMATVAEAVCSDPSIICGWENGKTMPRDISKKAISEFYNVPQEEIWAKEPIRNESNR